MAEAGYKKGRIVDADRAVTGTNNSVYSELFLCLSVDLAGEQTIPLLFNCTDL